MADLGIAGGKGRGVIFRKGEIVRTVDEPEFLSALIEEGDKVIAEMERPERHALRRRRRADPDGRHHALGLEMLSDEDRTKVESAFNGAMALIYERAKRECNYPTNRFLQMLSDHGGVDTARLLTMSNEPSEGFTALWEYGRLDLTVKRIF